MKVLHIFSHWLNQTMNWANAIIQHCDAEHHVAADIFIDHQMDDSGIHKFITPRQNIVGSAKNEWNIGLLQKAYSGLFKRYHQKKVTQYILDEKIEAIHFHFATEAARHMDLLSELEVVKVVSFYGYDYEMAPFNNPQLQEVYDRIFQEVDAVITEGAHGKSILSNIGCASDKIHIVPLGIEPKNITSNKRKGRTLNLVQPATFTPKKGQDITIKALGLLPEDIKVECTFFGEVANQEYFEKLKLLGQNIPSGRIAYKDFIPLDQFEKELQNYDAIIQPSRYAENKDCEGGAPVTLLHAQSLGLPVLSTFHCDIPNIVQDRKTAYLVEEGDPVALAAEIERLYNLSCEQFGVMSRNASQWANTEFDIAKCGQRLKEVYQDISTLKMMA